jgi:uncharacterized protein (DUF1499 family)
MRSTPGPRAAALVLILAAACAAPVHGETPMADAASLDPLTVSRPASPNAYLAAPAGTTRAAPDETVEDFPLPAAELAEAWARVVLAQPRTEILARGDEGLLVAAVQRSRVFGFVDDVVARAVPRGDGASTLAVYSRSRLGWHDMGVNRARVRDWLAALRGAVAAR